MEMAMERVRAQGGEIHFKYEAALKGFAASLPERALQGVQNNPHVAFIQAEQVISNLAAAPLWPSTQWKTLRTGLTATVTERTWRRIGGATYGVAKNVILYAVRVLDCSGSGTNAGVIAGVDWVTAQAVKPAVANMSLGGSADAALDAAVANSINSGIAYAIAAGNSRRDACKFSPARVPLAITVAATTSTNTRASYSNYGTCVDLFAPGSSITSARYTSTTATNTISGTSMATPHVIGVAALYLQAHPAATPSEVTNAIKAAATPNAVIAPKGSPNLLLYSPIP